MKEITDHPWIGAKVKYNKVVGTIVAARTGGHMPVKGIRDKGEGEG